jgi:hypothetical protein
VVYIGAIARLAMDPDKGRAGASTNRRDVSFDAGSDCRKR